MIEYRQVQPSSSECIGHNESFMFMLALLVEFLEVSL